MRLFDAQTVSHKSKNCAFYTLYSPKSSSGGSAQLVIALKEKQPGWPVPLVKPVKNPDAVAALKAKKAGKDKTLPKSKPAAAAPTAARGSVRGKKDPGWLHGAISKEAASGPFSNLLSCPIGSCARHVRDARSL